MNAIEISGLQKTYANGLCALNGIDLHVAAGDFFALLGPNGAGKSTTISIISSLVRKSAGSVSVFGLDMDQHLNDAKSMLGIVPQEINFHQFETCLEILVHQAGYYGIRRRVAVGRAEKYLSRLGLWARRNDQSRTLSGGLKRRLMIARALVHEPRVLILDEPTAGVDVELRRSMWDFLLEINRNGTTIVLTTHYLEEAEKLCRSIAIIDKGTIIENTTIRNLLTRLNTETFVLDLDRPCGFLPALDDYIMRTVDSETVEVDLGRGQDLNRLFALLTGHGIRVRSMRNKANRLEELFIRLLDSNSGAAQ